MSVNMVIGTSHKTYFGYQQTRQWCRQVAEILQQQSPELLAQLELFTFPATPALESVLQCFAGTAMATGVQNICGAPQGAWTGENSSEMVSEMGGRYAEIGHAERRRYFAETTELIQQKITRSYASQLTPVICIGEELEVSPQQAADIAIQQVDELLVAFAGEPLPATIFAWEPQWAIGAEKPASDGYIRFVCKTLRNHLHEKYGRQCQVIYGGSAGPGLLSRLWPDVDGIFLGRFAHQPSAFGEILAEAGQILSKN